MIRTTRTLSALAAAGLLAIGASAFAQTSMPATQGQASTMTPAGVPNPTQRPDGTMPAQRDNVRAEARANNRMTDNTTTPGGTASTMMNGQPNATPPVNQNTRAEVRADTKAEMQRRPKGNTGERPDVPTNPKNMTGTPK